MRRLLIPELSSILKSAAKDLLSAAAVAEQSEAEAMRLASAGFSSVEANAVGMEGYKSAGQLAFKAIQSVMYTQAGQASSPDLLDGGATCAGVFANISANGFKYPVFAKTGCPKLFKSFSPFVVGAAIAPPTVDAAIDNVAQQQLVFVAHAHEEYAMRRRLAALDVCVNPFEALHNHANGANVLKVFTCDAVGVRTTATPINIEDGTVVGLFEDSATDPVYKMTATTPTIDIDGSINYPGSDASGYEAWLDNEYFISLNVVYPAGDIAADDYVTPILTSGDDTDIVLGTVLLIRCIADDYSDLIGELTNYDPST
jgi:hypothetical protein